MDRGGAADDADGATGEERTGGGAKARTDADGGGTRSFVEGWKARVSAHITWPMAIAAADAAPQKELQGVQVSRAAATVKSQKSV